MPTPPPSPPETRPERTTRVPSQNRSVGGNRRRHRRAPTSPVASGITTRATVSLAFSPKIVSDPDGGDDGGVVWAGAGKYLHTGTLTIPKGVTLLGAWTDPDGKNGKDRPGGQNTAKLTTLLARPAAGPDDPLVDIVGGGGLRGITVYYPDQKAASPAAYGPTVRLGGNGS